MTFKEVLIERGLTNRQVQVAELICGGYTNKFIGENLNIKVETVKYHATVLYKKLGIKCRAKLVAISRNYETKCSVRLPQDKTLPLLEKGVDINKKPVVNINNSELPKGAFNVQR